LARSSENLAGKESYQSCPLGHYQQLNAQNEKGKTIRRTVSFASWLIALVAGDFLGAWFQIQLEPKVQLPKK